MNSISTDAALRRAVIAVGLLNLAYFGIEFTTAALIHSVSLFADSIDFLEDASVNGLILLGLGWSARGRARLAMLLALLLLMPGLATLWSAWRSWQAGTIPASLPLTFTGLGALAVNATCALILAKIRHAQGSLTRAAFLSARNDVVANVAIIIAGVLTALHPSRWPDLIVGLGIFVMNLGAAREIFEAAQAEHRSAA